MNFAKGIKCSHRKFGVSALGHFFSTKQPYGGLRKVVGLFMIRFLRE